MNPFLKLLQFPFLDCESAEGGGNFLKTQVPMKKEICRINFGVSITLNDGSHHCFHE